MIDLKRVKADIAWYKQNIIDRNLSIDFDAFLEIEEQKNTLAQKIDELRNTKNLVSKEIPKLSPDDKVAKIAEMKGLGDELEKLEEEYKPLEEKFNYILHRLPNFLDPSAAIGKDDEENRVEEFFLEKTAFDFTPKDHIDIALANDWANLEKWAEISWARFWYLKGELALLNMAIINYAISVLSSKGFEFMIPPYMVKEAALFGTGFLPAGEDGVYAVNPGEDDLYLIGTSEIPLTSYHMNETIDLENPKLYVGYSPCFRREAGSYGKDTRGILRGHQFEKVEMVVFCKPEESQVMHDKMVAIEEEVWQSLKIPYQKVNVCSGDLWNPAMKKYDLEAWVPTQEKYREVTSCSNMGEFQSRRLGIKYKNSEGKKEFAHTLNGTVIALSRCLIAIMENYQTKDWKVMIPEVLQPFMGGKTHLG
jgi:seryl-tRNA synthetase